MRHFDRSSARHHRALRSGEIRFCLCLCFLKSSPAAAATLTPMLQPYRDNFNANFTPAKYIDLVARLNHLTRTTVEFRVAETPCFFSRELINELAATGAELTHQLLNNPSYLQASNQTIPEQFRVPNENPQPNFMTVG